MDDGRMTQKQLLQELRRLRQRCADLEKMRSAYKEREQAFGELEHKRPEENKKESEKKYRELLEGSQDGFVMVDMDGHIQEFNQAYKEMLGYSAEELRKLTYVDLTPAKWHPMEAQIIRDQVLPKGYSSVYEKENIRKDGSVFPISLRTYLIKDANGNPAAMWAFVRDITGRKEMEKALRQSRDELEAQVQRRTSELGKANELLETVFSSINILIAYMDRDFTYVRVNRAYAEREGNLPEYYSGKNHFALFPNEENKAIFRRVVETGEPYFAYETPLVSEEHLEQGLTYWDWSVQPVKEPDGRVTGLVLSLINVTPRKRAEEALLENEELLRTVLETLPVGVWIIDRKGRINQGNPAGQKIWAGARKVGMDRYGEYKGWWLHSGKKIEPGEWGAARAIREGEISINEEIEIESFDGAHKIILHSALPIRNKAKEIVGAIVVNQEITELKRQERELREQARIQEGFFRSTITPLVFLDRDFNFIRVNQAYAQCCRREIGEFAGHNHFEFYPHPENEAIFKRVVEEKVPFQALAKPFHFPDHPEWGVTYWDWTLTPLLNEKGEVEFLVFALNDVTGPKRAEQELQESEKQLRYLSSQLLNAQEQERRRVALDLHDGLGQALTAIKFKVENFIHEVSRGRMKTKLQPLKDLIPIIQECVREIHRVQINLRPSILDDLGILATISWLCREFQSMYSKIHLEQRIDVLENEVPDPLRMIIYRILQEAFNNVAKHSQAKSLSLSLQRIDGKLELTIQDNGRGFDLQEALSEMDSGRGLGLISMRERAEQSGGYFSIESGTGKGTTIRVAWPMQP